MKADKNHKITIKDVQKYIEMNVRKTGFLIRKNTVWCNECGAEFNAEISPLAASVDCGYVTCPVCGRKIKVINCKKHECKDGAFFTILTTSGGMQVCRHFEIRKL